MLSAREDGEVGEVLDEYFYFCSQNKGTISKSVPDTLETRRATQQI